VLTCQRDFSGDLDGRADQRAASRSQNICLVYFAGGRSRCGGDGCGRAGGSRARHDRHRGGDVSGRQLTACDRRSDRIARRNCGLTVCGDFDLHLVTIIADDSLLRHLRLHAETGERSGTRRAQAQAHLC